MSSDSLGLGTNAELFLRRSLENGSAVLFTGAGFSASATNKDGAPLPLGQALREQLWGVAFPGQPFDTSSTLADIFDVAIRTARTATEALLRKVFTVDPSAIPEFYRDYFSVPWYRIYTLNIDDLMDAVQRRFSLPFTINTRSALGGDLPPPDSLTAVHVNGRLHDLPNVTFSAMQYAARTARSDLTYPNLVREMATHCTVFIGTQLDEPALWHHVALRGEKPRGRELRPRSYLVIPSVSPARAAMLGQFNVEHVAASAEEFWAAYIAPVAAMSLPRVHAASPLGAPFDDVALVRSTPVESPADFLLGREPDWGDLASGFAVARAFEERALADIEERQPRAVIVTGTAGSGKSTALRRMALSRQGQGAKVLWLRPEASQAIPHLSAAAVSQGAEVVAIDQAERFGRKGIDLLKGLLESGLTVYVAYSGSTYDDFGVYQALADYAPFEIETPLLTDEDIDAILDALERANRLGRLAGMSRERQFARFQQSAGRQLLVAMLEATSGQRFEDKIENECRSLAPALQTAYAVTALATSHRYPLAREDLLGAMSDVSVDGLDVVDRLLRQHLILRTKPGQGQLVLRHPVIARQVVTHYRSTGQLAEAIGRLAFVMASKYYSDTPRTPERRLLINLISHTYLGQVIDSVISVREFYQDLEPLLRDQADYWLQRGSYELERGDINLAENFLAQARGLSAGSIPVQTEWAYLMLKRACKTPDDVRAAEWADEGIDLLFEAIERSGKTSPHAYVVLARETIEWCKAGRLSVEESKPLLVSVRTVMRDGERYHGGNRYFREAAQEAERAYLMLATERAN